MEKEDQSLLERLEKLGLSDAAPNDKREEFARVQDLAPNARRSSACLLPRKRDKIWGFRVRSQTRDPKP
jgi:hypothetical protein